MENIKSILQDIKMEDNSIKRFQYIPYSEKMAKHVWFGIAKELIANIKIEPIQASVWSELIKYTHGVESCLFDIKKAICIIGGTGSGKTQTMNILNQYIKVDEVKYQRNGKIIPFWFTMVSSKEIVSDYSLNGYDGIAKYMVIGNLCIDDLGSEPLTSNHYGSKLDVLTEVIEMRYSKGLFTHFTTNLKPTEIEEQYKSRVYSRIVQTCNLVNMDDKDFRVE